MSLKNIQILVTAALLSSPFASLTAQNNTTMIGAWETGTDIKVTKIFTAKHFAEAIYDVKNKQFISTAGGQWSFDGKSLIEEYEFNSREPDLIGTQKTIAATLKNGKLIVTEKGKSSTEWIQVDKGGPGQLAGAWLVTSRNVNGEVQAIKPGARRTMKILSGTRFQWIAYNTDTKEFFGTGGGTYTTENGKYVENIEFFSRDNNRVGASLQFDFSIEEGNWRHKGLSSKGDPIDEVWTKREKIGL